MLAQGFVQYQTTSTIVNQIASQKVIYGLKSVKVNTCSCMAALWQLMTLFCKSLRDCSRYTKEGPAQGSDLPRSLHNLGSLLSHWPNRRRKSTKSAGIMVMKWLGQDWVHHEFLIRLVLLAIRAIRAERYVTLFKSVVKVAETAQVFFAVLELEGERMSKKRSVKLGYFLWKCKFIRKCISVWYKTTHSSIHSINFYLKCGQRTFRIHKYFRLE